MRLSSEEAARLAGVMEGVTKGVERQRALGPLADPATVSDIERYVTEKMRDHQESNGSYSCDPHVMVGYVIAGLLEAHKHAAL